MNLLKGLGKTVTHFFPKLTEWIAFLNDTRRQELCTYDRRFLTWMGLLVFRKPHCEHCLRQTVNGKTICYHHVLEAKFVTPEGIAISVGSEFIENADPHATKQDCELNWKIENEGFNIQKNGGFGLEHAYSHGNWQIKNLYLLMQVAHLLLQLLERGHLLEADCRQLYGSLHVMGRRLSEALRNCLLSAEALDPAVRIRVRLDSS